MNRRYRPESDTSRPRRPDPGAELEAFNLGEWLDDLWDGRYIILFCTLAFLAGGGFLLWREVPVYQAQGLLQLSGKKTATGDPSLAKLEGLFAEPGDAQAESEILKSDMVLGRAVKALGLDITAQPQLLPVIGAALARSRNEMPRIEVDALQVPDRLLGRPFPVLVLPEGKLAWKSPDGKILAVGRPLEPLLAMIDGKVARLVVRSVAGKPGQEFLVTRRPPSLAIEDLRKNFTVEEKGKDSNVLGLTFKGPSPTRCADVLNTVVTQYIRYKYEKNSGEAVKTRAALAAKLGPLKAQLDASEARLNHYRSQYGSVDASKEAEGMLSEGANLASQISALEQKKQDALRTFTPNSDVVITLNQQIQKLREESARLGSRMQVLPRTQQEIVRLSREVQINTEIYTTLVNNIQQIDLANSANIGNLTVVDPAAVSPDPLGAKPTLMLVFYGCLGLAAGIGLAMLAQLLRKSITDHRIIESKLDLPVLVTIPHSRPQEKHSRRIDHGKAGPHLLAAQDPDDLAIESLRSLRTTLLFNLKDPASRTLMITGPSPEIGKSFVCANLSIMMAQTGAKVLLVDADLRRGNLHRYFGRKNRLGGFSDVLAGRLPWTAVAQPTEFEGLDLMATGTIPSDSSHLLLSPKFDAFVGEAAAAYDFLVFDAPPLLPVTDATIIGAKVGTLLLVARYGQHTLDELQACVQRVEDHGRRFTGCIFNDIQPSGLGYGYQEYRYSYHYKYK
jgi:tyrosine-protein kinase Etk/Wzc